MSQGRHNDGLYLTHLLHTQPICVAAEQVCRLAHRSEFAAPDSLGPDRVRVHRDRRAFFGRAVLSSCFTATATTAVLNLLNALLLQPTHARLRYWSAWTMFALIVVIGSIPGARADAAEVASGVVLHSCAYAVLAFLIFTGGSGTPAQRAAKAVLTIAAMGAIDESVQSFLPYRHGAVHDWLVDCTAALVTSSLMWTVWSTRKTTS